MPSTAAQVEATRAASLSGAEVDEPRPVGECGPLLLRELQRQARLAAAADAGQRQQPRRRQQAREVCERRLAADEARALLRQVVTRRLGGRGHRRRGRRLLQRRGQPVAVARQRRDRARAEQLAQVADLGGDVVLFHHQPGPDEVEQFLLGDQPLVALGQREQQIEGAAAQGHRLAAHAQHTFGRVQLEVAEAQGFVSAGGWHGQLSQGSASGGVCRPRRRRVSTAARASSIAALSNSLTIGAPGRPFRAGQQRRRTVCLPTAPISGRWPDTPRVRRPRRRR